GQLRLPATSDAECVKSKTSPSRDTSTLARMGTGTSTTPSPSTTTTTLPISSAVFSDVDPNSPYAADIATLYQRGVISGFRDGTFGPNKPVTRQQFAKMIVLTLGYQVSPVSASAFKDVAMQLDPDDPRYPSAYIEACAQLGITIGKTPDTFGPYDSISRAQLITMVARAANLPAAPVGYVPPFPNFSPVHYPWALRASAAGLLNGLPGMGPSYNFWANASRAEVSIILVNLLQR
ncbi:MAG: S-layer homology domain-containing protein, partial [Actinobacteria bacterium]|nr:S-layer homology domain-containing protein [Actinomycetota bacterium]